MRPQAIRSPHWPRAELSGNVVRVKALFRGLIASASCAAVAGATALASYQAGGSVHRLFHSPLDVTVGGHAAPAGRDIGAWLNRKNLNATLPDLVLATHDDHLPVPAMALGFSVDIPETRLRVQRALPAASWQRRLQRAFRPTPSWTDVDAVLSFDAAVARARLRRLAAEFDRAPVNARLDIASHRRIEAVPGRALDVDACVERLRLIKHPGEGLELVFRSVAPEVHDHDLPDVDVSRVLARFETDFRKKAGRRAINIRRAAKLINGHILGPGEVFSFNDVVGDRTERNGFVMAPVIVNDELEPGLGGGVCQAATTVFAAAVLGGLQTVHRRSHSRPTGYAPLGLDAAVVYGKVDLRMKNPYDVPLMIRAYFPSKYVLRVEWLGINPPDDVDHRYAVTQKQEFYRRVVETPELAPGEFERTQEGGYGYDIVSTVTTTEHDGTQHRTRYPSKYYPIPEVYRVGPGTSLDLLPELPEGATHVQVPTSGEVAEVSAPDLIPEGL